MNNDFEDEDLKPSKGCGKYDYFDWYDSEKVEKLNQTRSKQWLKLYVKLKEAKKNGDEEALKKARETFRKHEAENRILKKYAEDAGNCWC